MVEKAESERSPLVDLIGEFWEPVDLKKKNPIHAPGQMYWAPIIYRDDDLLLLRLSQYDPTNERRSKYEMSRLSETPNPFDHAPVKELNLRNDEELVVFKCKHRSAMLFSVPMVEPTGEPPREKSFLLLPHYTFHADDPASFKEAVRLFEYNALFHAPASNTLGLKDGYFRFDRMTVVPRNSLNDVMPQRLTPDALVFLQAWFDAYKSGVLRDELLADLITEARTAREKRDATK
ncbi:MAG TPA: hypothetical protein VFC31_01455 [Candidatus Limnocylindria bacterium]|nr:hypothetical protein [Candidatus Limnocylindria bacterium]